jgi:hypothetical protein
MTHSEAEHLLRATRQAERILRTLFPSKALRLVKAEWLLRAAAAEVRRRRLAERGSRRE